MTRMADGYDNLFPEPLRRTIMDCFGVKNLGAALLPQQAFQVPETESDGESHPLAWAAAELLHAEELARASSYRLAKRRTEFFTGRIAAKMALVGYLATRGIRPELSAVKITNEPSGRPAVRMGAPPGDHLPPTEISITHGGAYAAALATEFPCGIDLQEQRDTLVRVLDKYCLPEEERLLATCLPETAPVSRLSLLWSAKEAAKKACSERWMPGFLDLRLVAPVTRRDDCHIFRLELSAIPAICLLPAALIVLATTFNQYGLAVCIANEDRTHAGTAGS